MKENVIAHHSIDIILGQIVSNHMVTLWLTEPMINCYPKTWYETINHHLYIENSKQFHDFYYLK